MATVSITIDINPDYLGGVTDETLAAYWHIAQANPADGFDRSDPGELAAKIGWEIIRRWLAQVPPEMYHHQQMHYWHRQLTTFATYEPGSPDWHAGRWVLKPSAPGQAADPDPGAVAP